MADALTGGEAEEAVIEPCEGLDGALDDPPP
jgi:hypothetical protein